MSTGDDPLRVCIDARIMHGEWGGVEQFALGLATALSRLHDGEEEYLFLTSPGADGWLRPVLAGPCRVLQSVNSGTERVKSRIAAIAPSLARASAFVRERLRLVVPESNGTVERAGVDLVHFTHQFGFRTRIPSIYHPHDLQHVHLPQFFTKSQLRVRDATYRTLCGQAAMVAVASRWVKRDLVEHLQVPEDKISVVPLAPPVEHYRRPDADALRAARVKFALPDRFALYPAQTWPHKNHVGLLEAIAEVRERDGFTIPLVCTGRVSEFASVIRDAARTLGLEGDLRLLGFVGPDELQAVYAVARCVVIPSLFEAASFPMFEAFSNGVPVACSNVTSLPEQAGDAALVFDPRDRRSMSDALRAVWSDDAVRSRLVERGRDRVARFTWERTARIFRAHYRRLARRTLTPGDLELLSAPPLL